uniref:PDZ domain-containing protein n=1 Tax=Rhabditophanes sp. KR3021 TaxID=114890 RepID=A0AC35U4K9_9BILA
MVTVRMNRADIKTPWGFRVSIPGLITGVEDGSLAERAGIQNGDVIEEIQGERVKDIERIKNLVNIPVNEIELVLYRNMMSTRLWRPTITDNSNYVESNAKQTIIPNPKVLVNLEHRSMNQDPLINGFNCSAKPFSATAQSKPLSGGVDASNYQMSKSLHNTFNTDKAEQYYHESGGLFGSDPNAKYGFGHKKEQPAYLNSETLKMIQEDDQNKETLKSVVFARDKSATPNRTSIPTQSRGPLNPNLPICFHCGRNIL